MGRFRPFWLFAFAALLAADIPSPSQAQVEHNDSVTGLEIPLLPGQWFLRFRNGCGTIADIRANFQVEIQDYSWIGSCKFGVIDGPGLLVHQNQYMTEPQYEPITAELGYFRPRMESNAVFLPRTSARNEWEQLTINRDPRTWNEGKLYEPIGREEVMNLALYSHQTLASGTDEYVHIIKRVCLAGGSNGATRNYGVESDMRGGKGAEISRVKAFCTDQTNRLYSRYGHGGDVFFTDEDYGFYYIVYLMTNTTDYATGRQRQQLTTKLCPGLNTLDGCEQLWQPALAPYLAKFDEMKAQEEAAFTRRSAEARQRFAPLRAAWVARIRAAIGAGE